MQVAENGRLSNRNLTGRFPQTISVVDLFHTTEYRTTSEIEPLANTIAIPDRFSTKERPDQHIVYLMRDLLHIVPSVLNAYKEYSFRTEYTFTSCSKKTTCSKWKLLTYGGEVNRGWAIEAHISQ